ncbi:MAG: GspH/FimT family pseudopilin [Aliidiomarina sp.]|uniref:GspH/FimT family pseudopilin n=1 Tax=Aliidiomarina sp. TaxID=1872439 RepID=UPI0025C30E74|nr:GspH/FimT family pseudopilin [Aliidiomarina sp.]MCH8502238.1 GspH/FimT family pseudopilin [Aliidiomarina sp.]
MERGFTLHEVMLVCGILGFLLLLSLPSLQTYRHRFQLQQAADDLTQLVRSARLYAIANNHVVWVGAAYNGEVCMWFDEQRPANCTTTGKLANSPAPQVRVNPEFGNFKATRFFPGSGMAGFVQGRFELFHEALPEESLRIVVSSLGRIRTCAVGPRQLRTTPC